MFINNLLKNSKKLIFKRLFIYKYNYKLIVEALI